MAEEPAVFGRYQLLEPLAKGGMAEVFKAKLAAAAGTEKLVCIKRILPHLSRNQDFISLFVQEARTVLPLTHGNVTQVFDFGEENGVYYLAMEYIAGQNLHDVLRRVRETGATLDIAATLYIAAEVCKGLQYAHGFVDGKGQKQIVVHRDVTPQNILISYNGEVKLTDFGIALAATKAGAEDGVVRGKACYLSPEQVGGHPGMPASDIFSLGATLCEMLTGARVFEGANEADSLRRVREAEVDPPSHHNPDVDEALDAVVLRALARDPAERYARAGDMQVALTQALHKRSPDYTADTLAATMRELFAWEMARGSDGGASGDPARDRLLFQLSRAGIKVDATQSTTEELLALGTVAIPGASAPRSRGRLRRFAPLFGVVAGIVVVAVVALLVLRTAGGDGPKITGPDELEGVAYQDTDHLTPPSIKRDGSPGVVKDPPDKKTDPPGPERNPPRKVAPANAFLNCNSWPWSVVFLDGRRLRGNTPLFRVKVAAGRHQLRFFNPELGLSKEVQVTVDPGEQKTVAVSLQQ